MAAATAFSAYGAYQQGQSSKDLANYNAQVDQNNAKAKQYAAEDASRRGGIAEDAHRAKVRQMLGTQRATMAANGGDLTDQSSMNILSDTARYGELDALTLRSNAAREAWGLNVQADNDLAQAAGSRFQGRAAARAGTMSAAGTLLNGGAQAYSAYKNPNMRIG